MADIPILKLPLPTRNIVCTSLNHKGWRTLAYKMGFTFSQIDLLKNFPNPTSTLLIWWTNNTHKSTLNNFYQLLLENDNTKLVNYIKIQLDIMSKDDIVLIGDVYFESKYNFKSLPNYMKEKLYTYCDKNDIYISKLKTILNITIDNDELFPSKYIFETWISNYHFINDNEYNNTPDNTIFKQSKNLNDEKVNDEKVKDEIIKQNKKVNDKCTIESLLILLRLCCIDINEIFPSLVGNDNYQNSNKIIVNIDEISNSN